VTKFENTWTYENINVGNSCTGESVLMSGTVTVKTHRVLANGVYHTTEHWNYNLSGVGNTSGNKYKYKANRNFSSKSSTCDIKRKRTYRFNFISQGKAPNLKIRQDYTLTYDCVDLDIDSETTVECN